MPAPTDPVKRALWKQRLSVAGKGRKLSPEHCKKLSEAMTGKKHSPEILRKMSEAHKGKKRGPMSPEARRHISEAHKGKKLSLEHRRKLSVVNRSKKYPNRTYGTIICRAPGCNNIFTKTGPVQSYCPDCHAVPGYTKKLNHSGGVCDLTRDQFKPLCETTHCPWCKCKLNHDYVNGQQWTLDRIIPGSKDGRYTTENTQVLCAGCNSSKGDRDTPSLERKDKYLIMENIDAAD